MRIEINVMPHDVEEFPVIFPVCKELAAERGSLWTASAARYFTYKINGL